MTTNKPKVVGYIAESVLDHIIVGGCSQTLTTSFAERGML